MKQVTETASEEDTAIGVTEKMRRDEKGIVEGCRECLWLEEGEYQM